MQRSFQRDPALLVDFGGVITESVIGTFERACLTHRVDPAAFVAEAFSAEHAADSPFALLELGCITVEEFVERVAPVLARHATADVDAKAWLTEVQRTTQRVDAKMAKALQTLYERGVQTVLVSNSWGPRDTYPWHLLPSFCDVSSPGKSDSVSQMSRFLPSPPKRSGVTPPIACSSTTWR